MSDDVATELLRRQESMATDRAVRDQQSQEIADLINPARADFTTKRTPGEKRMEKIFDGTSGMASENLVGGLYGLMCSPANIWFALESAYEELNDDPEVKAWNDDASRRMRNTFAAGGNRFYTEIIDYFGDVIDFGTAVFYEEEMVGRGEIFFCTRHLAECWIAENRYKRVDTVYRKFQYSARQSRQEWGDRVGPGVQKALEKNPEQKFDFLHAVMPAADAPGAKSNRPFASFYVDVEAKAVLSRAGYFELPYQVARWSTRARDVYGDGPGSLALPDTKMVNQMSKTTLIGAQLAIDPVKLAADELALRGARSTPGQIIYGGIDATSGRKMVDVLNTGGDVRLGLEMEEQRRNAIRECFFYSLLLMVQQPNMTATEFLGRQEEKIRLMGPHLGRIQSEFLDPLIDRVFAIMYRAGAFLPPPPALRQYPQLKIRYLSPLARMQKTSEAGALLRAMEALTPLASVKPEILDNIDGDAYARAVMDAFGVPAKVQRDPREVAAGRQAQQRQQQLAQLAELAKTGGAGAKDIAAAVQTGQEVRQQAGLPGAGAAPAPAKARAA